MRFIESFKNAFAESKAVAGGAICLGTTALCSLPVLASANTPTTVTYNDFKTIIDAMTAQISVSTIVGVLASGMAAVIGIVFMWWGVRKVAKMLFSAFRKGKGSV